MKLKHFQMFVFLLLPSHSMIPVPLPGSASRMRCCRLSPLTARRRGRRRVPVEGVMWPGQCFLLRGLLTTTGRLHSTFTSRVDSSGFPRELVILSGNCGAGCHGLSSQMAGACSKMLRLRSQFKSDSVKSGVRTLWANSVADHSFPCGPGDGGQQDRCTHRLKGPGDGFLFTERGRERECLKNLM